MKVQLCKMYMDEDIKSAIGAVLDSGIYINGPNVELFEKEFAAYNGVNNAVSVNSGTSALFSCFNSLKLNPKDEIIVPSHSFFSSISPAFFFQIKPIFVDINPFTYNMKVEDIAPKISKKTKAIVTVHMYGVPTDIDPLLEISEKYQIPIIEDCAHSLGSQYNDKHVGTFGLFGCFSFFPSKIITVGGDGGMILTKNEKFIQELKMFRNNGRQEKYVHEILGLNLRMSEIHAAIGRIQLKKLPDFIKKRNEIVQRYNDSFSSISQIKCPQIPKKCNPTFYVYTIQVPYRDELVRFLNKKGISTGIYYPIPIHLQPYVLKNFSREKLPNTENIIDHILSLPLSPGMTDEEIEYVIENVQAFFTK